ncbi:MAG: NAD-dependent epimerase/dehydratase family protein [Candidatus Hydrogenedens sp.]|jgi:nucleoside-diphosphate-sugar epimerase|nr:NAD-dependent epimerase/dehydratase family protein [Candidatus Hydrogenedens sp.]
MEKKVFVAGASGAVGRRLCRLLVADGWQVTGTTRSEEKASMLQQLGVKPTIVDVFDKKRLTALMKKAAPEMVIHQLTDLPPGLDPAQMEAALIRNARLRETGTANLVAATVAAGAKRLVAQSIAFIYAPGRKPYTEEMPLAPAGPTFANTVNAVISLEEQVLTGSFTGIVLRYGKFYGPGTGFNEPAEEGPLHVDDAADAARRALTLGERGVYNIAEDDGTVSIEKAKRELHWQPGFRLDEKG